MMKWQKLLSFKRLGKEKQQSATNIKFRTPFQQDFDRIVFSSEFRRLQNKTQVFPMPKSDYVRNRLTHSLETASVGRSLGNIAGQYILKKYPELNSEFNFSDIGAIVSSACLAHDIGNPPFGHSGEDAISEYFKSDLASKFLINLNEYQLSDLQNFEGNAAGFRILVNTPEAQSKYKGGLGLTYATLSAFVKYPKLSFPNLRHKKIASLKKYSFLYSEKDVFYRIAEELEFEQREIDGELYYSRFPLAYLVEAADDICYTIIDYEDGFQEGLVSFHEVEEVFIDVLGVEWQESYGKYKQILNRDSKLHFLRSKVINTLINQVSKAFEDNEELLLKGEYDKSLLDEIPAAAKIDSIKKDSFERIYSSTPVLKIEAAGYRVLPELLDIFINAIFNPGKEQNRRLIKLIPDIYLDNQRKMFEDDYQKLLNITMFISGMTDKAAVELYRQLTGISIGN